MTTGRINQVTMSTRSLSEMSLQSRIAVAGNRSPGRTQGTDIPRSARIETCSLLIRTVYLLFAFRTWTVSISKVVIGLGFTLACRVERNSLLGTPMKTRRSLSRSHFPRYGERERETRECNRGSTGLDEYWPGHKAALSAFSCESDYSICPMPVQSVVNLMVCLPKGYQYATM